MSESVPRIPDRERLTERMLRYLPDDRVTIAHGDFKMDNFVCAVCASVPASASWS